MNYKFRAHESFALRKGWLRKGMKFIDRDGQTYIFTSKDSNEQLAIGKNMVKSLRYWLQAFNVSLEPVSGKRYQEFTDFGKAIWENDSYLEEQGTLWLLHYQLVTNKELATAWYWFFNVFSINEFTKEFSVEQLKEYIKYVLQTEVSTSSIEGDITCIISTYLTPIRNKKITPEENIECPLADLNLIELTSEGRSYKKRKIMTEEIDSLIVLYALLDKFYKDYDDYQEVRQIPIKEVIEGEGSISRVFNMDIFVLNNYLDRLHNEKYITVTRTAGLDVITILTDMKPIDVIHSYYKKINKG
ncbi:hypothetical protein HNQ80_001170 [Anaerosolibacter carboniphilus]|uniref:DUF4007 domain-containing protein n=1 Tax=Anaerosolibacter carboniphilus TaxID=1417629 RepID=A0A841KP62_9FIRM|nr:DUF4007 family protein [Anaerosolibacter carboniphilus]MBB6215081.1 hypothetical protein [Anaerosolibacter carboniphilus]